MPVGTALARPAHPRMVSYSACVAEAVAGPPQRGLVHSVFHAAANIVFPDNFVLSLNTAISSRMPNGIQLPTLPDTMPISHLRVGMPILLGAQRLCIQPLDYTLDLSHAIQWHPHIERPAVLDMDVVRKNIVWLEQYVLKESWRTQSRTVGTDEDGRPQEAPPRNSTAPVPTIQRCPSCPSIVGTGAVELRGGASCGRPSSSTKRTCFFCEWHCPCGRPFVPVTENAIDLCECPSLNVIDMARALCGRGMGLTPSGDDMLAGWMAIGWLLHGPQPDFLAACQQIVAIAQQQTHLLSQCWLECAANGYVAEPVGTLLHALTQEDEQQLAHSSQAVLAMGATSGYDLIQGILLATSGL
ncbi:MAG: oxamate carbamoyltransferase subunit AllH family protein [Ktedonobacteraceae bacterium]